jgi:GT2 family glycosyltransferase
MIILDVRLKQDLSKVEFLKIFLHALKICFFYKLTLVLQSNSRTIKIKWFIKKDVLTSKIIIILRPQTRIIINNFSKLLKEISSLKEPTIIICQIIYQHYDTDPILVHLPKVSKLVIENVNYVNEIEIIAGIPDQEAMEKFIDYNRNVPNKISEFDAKINYKSFGIPIKVLKKSHELMKVGEVPINNYHISDKGTINQPFNVSLIIPTTLNKIDDYFTLPSLLDEATDLLNSINAGFEIILVVGPEVNKSSLENVTQVRPDLIVIHEKSMFNFSRRVNRGLLSARNELIWVLNDDIRISRHQSSIDDLLVSLHLAKKESTGIVGTFLIDGGLINHAGVQIYGEVADHVLRGSQFSKIEAMNAFRVREVTGVTGANMFFQKKTLEKLGLFDETFPAEFSDVEICLRANKSDLQNYVVRTKNFTHFESSTRQNSLDPRHQLLRTLTKYGIDQKIDPHHFTIPYCCLKEMSEINNHLKEKDFQGLVKK